MSTPGDDKPDPLDFSDFDLPSDEAGSVEGAPLADLPGEDPASSSGPLSDLFGDSLMPAEESPEAAVSADAPLEEVSPAEAGEAGQEPGALAAGFPAFDADSPLSGPVGVESSKKKKKKEKASKRKKEKQEGEEDGESFLQKLLRASPYVVILTLSFLALLIATIVLAVELARFRYDVNAQEAKQQAAVTAPAHSLLSRTTATA